MRINKEYVLHRVARCQCTWELNRYNDYLWEFEKSFYMEHLEWVNKLFVTRERELRDDRKL